jgi:hypothetical protein
MKKELITLFKLWLGLNVLPFFFGIKEGSNAPDFNNHLTPLERIEYVFPGYRVGCYLGSALVESK